MANSWNSTNKYFDIDTSTNVAGLAALKGSAPASTDSAYVFNGATLTFEQNCSLLTTYRGDNYAGNAATKTGHIVVSAGATLTLYTTVSNAGLDGEGSTSSLTLAGESGNPAVITDNANAMKSSNANCLACPVYSSHGRFQGIRGLFFNGASAKFDIQNTTFDTCSYGLSFAAALDVSNCVFKNNAIVDCVNSILESNTTSVNVEALFADGSSYIQHGTGRSAFTMYLSTKRYFSYRESAVPLSSAPEWDDTTGIQSLTAAGDRKLTASWNGAADPFGEQVAYRIYLRAGAAPDGFGKGGDYYLCETTGAGFDIACTPDGDALTAGTEYHAIVRAVSSAGYEDTNTVSLSATASDENADRLRKIDGVVQTILALSLS